MSSLYFKTILSLARADWLLMAVVSSSSSWDIAFKISSKTHSILYAEYWVSGALQLCLLRLTFEFVEEASKLEVEEDFGWLLVVELWLLRSSIVTLVLRDLSEFVGECLDADAFVNHCSNLRPRSHKHTHTSVTSLNIHKWWRVRFWLQCSLTLCTLPPCRCCRASRRQAGKRTNLARAPLTHLLLMRSLARSAAIWLVKKANY